MGILLPRTSHAWDVLSGREIMRWIIIALSRLLSAVNKANFESSFSYHNSIQNRNLLQIITTAQEVIFR